MTGIKKRLGSLLGPQGKPGGKGDKGDQGLPGPNAIPADEAVATYVSSPETQTRAALDQAFEGQKGSSFNVHLIGLWGQSNMSGRGREFTEMTDPEHPRIFQVGFKDRTLRVASEPLDMQDTPSGIGPGLQFARHYLKTLPSNDVVVLVPSARGGTALSSASGHGWRWGIPGGRSDLALTHLQEAEALASEQWPSAKVSVAAILWHQGESDSSDENPIPGEDYQADLDALIHGVRTELGDPVLPFIVGQMLPEAMGEGTREEINGVHQNTPYRVPYTGFSFSAPEGHSNGDRLHFNAAGQRINAKNMFDEFLRVRSGLMPVNPKYEAPLLPIEGPVVWSDTFTRADADTLGNTETGGLTWSTVKHDGIGSFHGIRDHEVAHIRGIPEEGTVISYIDSGSADGFLEVDISATHSLMRPTFRVQDEDNYLALFVSSSLIRLRVYGGPDNFEAIPRVAKTGPVGVLMDGDQITIYENGLPLGGPLTVPNFTDRTWHGIQTADAETAIYGRISSMQFRELVLE